MPSGRQREQNFPSAILIRMLITCPIQRVPFPEPSERNSRAPKTESFACSRVPEKRGKRKGLFKRALCNHSGEQFLESNHAVPENPKEHLPDFTDKLKIIYKPAKSATSFLLFPFSASGEIRRVSAETKHRLSQRLPRRLWLKSFAARSRQERNVSPTLSSGAVRKSMPSSKQGSLYPLSH